MSCVHENSSMFLNCWETNSWKSVRSLPQSVIFLFLSWNSWGQRRVFHGICKYYNICNDSRNKFYWVRLTVSLVRWKNPPAFRVPNNCSFILFIGTRFGLMQVKTGLCHILSRFEVAPCQETTVPIVSDSKSFLMQLHGELQLSFNRVYFRNHTHSHTNTHTHTNIYMHMKSSISTQIIT